MKSEPSRPAMEVNFHSPTTLQIRTLNIGQAQSQNPNIHITSENLSVVIEISTSFPYNQAIKIFLDGGDSGDILAQMDQIERIRDGFTNWLDVAAELIKNEKGMHSRDSKSLCNYRMIQEIQYQEDVTTSMLKNEGELGEDEGEIENE